MNATATLSTVAGKLASIGCDAKSAPGAAESVARNVPHGDRAPAVHALPVGGKPTSVDTMMLPAVMLRMLTVATPPVEALSAATKACWKPVALVA